MVEIRCSLNISFNRHEYFNLHTEKSATGLNQGLNQLHMNVAMVSHESIISVSFNITFNVSNYFHVACGTSQDKETMN
jgi:hypothetical protein